MTNSLAIREMRGGGDLFHFVFRAIAPRIQAYRPRDRPAAGKHNDCGGGTKGAMRAPAQAKGGDAAVGVLDLLFSNRQLRKALADNRQRLYRMALAWSRDPALADDLTQEALDRALKHAQQLRDTARLDAWLFRILSNCWHEHLRRRRPGVPLDEIQLVEWHTPEREQQRQDIVSRVQAEIARLPVGQRQVVTLVDIEGFSYAETAEVLEVPVGTVMSRLNRARSNLRAALGDMRDAAEQPTKLRRVK
jgi:RNA polymerase sigma-70 factor (ECF subfamily)